MKDSNDYKKKMSSGTKFGLIAISVAFIIAIIAMIIVVLATVQEGKVDVSNSIAEEFYVKENETEGTTESSEGVTEASIAEETAQSPSEIAATQEIKPEDLIGNGLSEEEWDFIYEQAEKNAPNAVKPFSIVELSNRYIKMYDANNKYYEWVPN